jgi:hypothetical protein
MSYKLVDLNREYKAITGEDAYLYASNPGDSKGTRYVFATSASSIIGEGAAIRHMGKMLEYAQIGMSHSEILYGKQRS